MAMNNGRTWLMRFLETYIIKEKRDRYCAFISTPLGFRKFIERLNHELANDLQHHQFVENKLKKAGILVPMLKKRAVADSSFFFGFQSTESDKELSIEEGVDALLWNGWGSLLVCPNTPIALYKEEDIGRLFYLEER